MKERRKIIDMTEQLPAGLDYQDAHWEAALGMIEAHEAKVAWYRVAGSILTAACVISAILFWTVEFESMANTIAQADLRSNGSQYLGQINVEVRTSSNEASINLFGDGDNASIEMDPVRSSISPYKAGNDHLEEKLNTLLDDIEDAPVADLNEGQTSTQFLDLAEDYKGEGETRNSEQAPIQEINDVHPEDLNSTSLSGEAPTPSMEEVNSSNPDPPAHLDITTIAFENSSIQKEDINSTAQPKVDIIDLGYEQWFRTIDEIDAAELLNEFDKTPIGVTSTIPSHKLWTPRKRLNVQALVGSNFWMDYMSKDWDLFLPELDENFGNLASLQENTEQALERVGAVQSRFESSMLFGLEADYDFNKKWSIRAGLHYFSANNLRFVEMHTRELGFDASNYQGEEADQDQGVYSVELPVYTTKLKYAALPVNLSYRFRNKWQVSIGLGLEYLIDGDNLLTEANHEGQAVMGQIHETRGYVTGFNYWNSFASAGANFYLTESITIGANYQYGLNDMTRPGVFALSTIDRPSRINGYLRFRIF